MYRKTREELKKKYGGIFKRQLHDESEGNIKTWAFAKTGISGIIHPTIPFIGKNYFCAKPRALVYASAENLTYLRDKNVKERTLLDNDDTAKDRCRYFYEKHLKEKSGSFFPFVHITPVNNGALLVIAAYLLKKFGVHYEDPFKLIEDIAAANFGKFSIRNDDGNANKDYGSKNKDNQKKLEISYEYVCEDLKVLKPDILIMPCKIYECFYDRLKNFDITVFPIYQITPTTINSRFVMGKYKDKYKRTKDVKELEKWHEKIGGYTEIHGGRGLIKDKTLDNFKAVYPYLDEVYLKYKKSMKKQTNGG